MAQATAHGSEGVESTTYIVLQRQHGAFTIAATQLPRQPHPPQQTSPLQQMSQVPEEIVGASTQLEASAKSLREITGSGGPCRSAYVPRRGYGRGARRHTPQPNFGPGTPARTRGIRNHATYGTGQHMGRHFVYRAVQRQQQQSQQQEGLEGPKWALCQQTDGHTMSESRRQQEIGCRNEQPPAEFQQQQQHQRTQAYRQGRRGQQQEQFNQGVRGALPQEQHQLEHRTQSSQQQKSKDQQERLQQMQNWNRHHQYQQPRHQEQQRSQCDLQQDQPQQQQQQQRPTVCRPVCSRPQVSGIPSVIVELQRLRRLYTTSFRFVYCHPLLAALLQQVFSLEKERASFRVLGTQVHGGTLQDAAAAGGRGADKAGDGCATTTEKREAHTEERNENKGSCCKDLSSCSSEASSCNGLCRFEVTLVPTDPEFDTTTLPFGLVLHVTVGPDYPGAATVLAAAPPHLACSTAYNPKLQNVASASSPASVTQGENAAVGSASLIPLEQQAALRQADLCAAVCAVGHGGTVTGDLPHAGSHSASTSDVASLRVCNEEINDFRRNAIEVVFSKVIEKQLKTEEREGLIRTALRAIDRHLREIFTLDMTPSPVTACQKPQTSWTVAEQQKLEEALVLYRRVADPVLRWRNISSHVGSRSANECAVRFQVCRQNILTQHRTAATDEGSDNQLKNKEDVRLSGSAYDEANVQEAESEQPSSGVAGKPALLRGCDVSLLEPTMDGVSTVHLSCVRLQVTCGRCKAPADMRVALPKDGATLDPAGCSVDCQKCQLRMGMRVQPTIGVGGNSLMRVAVVEPNECQLKDLLPCDFILSCDCCGASIKAREVLSGASRTNHCRHCHSKLTYGFQAAALGLAVVNGMGSGRSKEVHRSRADQNKQRKELGIVVGSPLVNFGTCKHYKKSFRWLRFPCCGKAYPCDVCHDNNEEHEHEWATRMICGFCSVEQPFANGKPCVCGRALTKSGGSAHWEGGTGCRDPTKMSRKDSRKYKLRNK